MQISVSGLKSIVQDLRRIAFPGRYWRPRAEKKSRLRPAIPLLSIDIVEIEVDYDHPRWNGVWPKDYASCNGPFFRYPLRVGATGKQFVRIGIFVFNEDVSIEQVLGAIVERKLQSTDRAETETALDEIAFLERYITVGICGQPDFINGQQVIGVIQQGGGLGRCMAELPLHGTKWVKGTAFLIYLGQVS